MRDDHSFKYYIYLIAKSRAISYLNTEKRRSEITEWYLSNESEELEKEKIEELKEMPTVNENPIQLSKQAQNWKDWLEYQKIKPEDFIRKYPEHKYISFIKEIIQNNSK